MVSTLVRPQTPIESRGTQRKGAKQCLSHKRSSRTQWPNGPGPARPGQGRDPSARGCRTRRDRKRRKGQDRQPRPAHRARETRDKGPQGEKSCNRRGDHHRAEAGHRLTCARASLRSPSPPSPLFRRQRGGSPPEPEAQVTRHGRWDARTRPPTSEERSIQAPHCLQNRKWLGEPELSTLAIRKQYRSAAQAPRRWRSWACGCRLTSRDRSSRGSPQSHGT